MRKKFFELNSSNFFRYQTILLRDKLLKILTLFFLVFDPLYIYLSSNYMSIESTGLYLLARVIMMFFLLIDLFLFVVSQFVMFCCNQNIENRVSNLYYLDKNKYKQSSKILKSILFTHVEYLCIILICVMCLYKGVFVIFSSSYINSSISIMLLDILFGVIYLFIDKKSKNMKLSFDDLLNIIE